MTASGRSLLPAALKNWRGRFRMDGQFKTAMNGFKKSDVLVFIDNQENEYRKREKSLKEQVAQLEGQVQTAQKEKDELQSQIDGARQEVESERQVGAQTRGQFAAMVEQMDALKTELFKNENLKNELQREISIHKQNSEAKAAEIAEKAAEIERLKSTINTISTTQQRISRVMVEAQNTADKIIDGAKEKAVCILCEAGQKMSAMLKHADEMKSEAELFLSRVDSFSEGVAQISGELTASTSGLGGEKKEQEPTSAVKSDDSEEPAAAEPHASSEQKKSPEKANPADCVPVKGAQPGALFDFSQNRRMFNWDKD
jgi:chromosome segregation ATPase